MGYFCVLGKVDVYMGCFGRSSVPARGLSDEISQLPPLLSRFVGLAMFVPDEPWVPTRDRVT